MPAARQTIEHVETLERYKHGFVTDIAQEFAPKGLSEATVRYISAQKNEPEWMLEWRLGAFERWLALEEPTWARVDFPRIDYQDAYYYAAPKKKDGPKSLDEVDPELLATYAKLGIPLKEQEVLARRPGRAALRGRCGVRQRLGGHHLQEGARRGGRDLLLDERGDPRARRAGAPVPGHGGAGLGQLLRLPEQRGLLRRQLRLRAAGRALPDGAFHLLPHQRRRVRPVRAHPDHRRQGGVRLLPRGLHRADARREPAARRRGRAGGARRRRDQVLDRAELVPGRRRGQGRHLQLRHQARRLPRRPLQGAAGPRSRPARRSPGSTRPASCAARARPASSTRSPSPTTASRPTPAPR